MSRGRVVIHKMKNEHGEVVTEKNEITEIIENFYRRLQSVNLKAESTRKTETDSPERRIRLANH